MREILAYRNDSPRKMGCSEKQSRERIACIVLEADFRERRCEKEVQRQREEKRRQSHVRFQWRERMDAVDGSRAISFTTLRVITDECLSHVLIVRLARRDYPRTYAQVFYQLEAYLYFSESHGILLIPNLRQFRIQESIFRWTNSFLQGRITNSSSTALSRKTGWLYHKDPHYHHCSSKYVLIHFTRNKTPSQPHPSRSMESK